MYRPLPIQPQIYQHFATKEQTPVVNLSITTNTDVKEALDEQPAKPYENPLKKTAVPILKSATKIY
jgi:hypothetical protein